MKIVWLAIGALACAARVFPCSLMAPVSNVEMVRDADVIVRAKAVDYIAPPNPALRTTGEADSKIRFRVLQVIRGPRMSEVILPGYLVNSDDFNDQASPYKFVRPGGRMGSCFANSYRAGAEFLLLLQKNTKGDLTVNWYPLGPVNEQLHPGEDPWLLWVQREAAKGKGGHSR